MICPYVQHGEKTDHIFSMLIRPYHLVSYMYTHGVLLSYIPVIPTVPIYC